MNLFAAEGRISISGLLKSDLNPPMTSRALISHFSLEGFVEAHSANRAEIQELALRIKYLMIACRSLRLNGIHGRHFNNRKTAAAAVSSDRLSGWIERWNFQIAA
jgi:hypothetical protein